MRVIREEKELLEVELEDEGIANLIARYCECDAAAVREHPFLVKPKVIVYSKNAREEYIKAIDRILADLKELRKSFERELRKCKK